MPDTDNVREILARLKAEADERHNWREYVVDVTKWVPHFKRVAVYASSQDAANTIIMNDPDNSSGRWHRVYYDAPLFERDAGADCVDCHVTTHGVNYYMVIDEIWAATGLEPDGGMLCLECLSRRLGRELHHEDFRVIEMNDETVDFLFRGAYPLPAVSCDCHDMGNERPHASAHRRDNGAHDADRQPHTAPAIN